jgi:MFS family permease
VPAACVFALGIIGWAILMAVPPKHATPSQFSARYFACILIVCAGYTNIPIIMAWTASNAPNESQRAVNLGMLNTVGQCLSVAAAFLFPKSEGPQYRKGSSINVAFQCLGLAIALGLSAWLRIENRRRDRSERPLEAHEEPATEDKYDLAPGFRYTT